MYTHLQHKRKQGLETRFDSITSSAGKSAHGLPFTEGTTAKHTTTNMNPAIDPLRPAITKNSNIESVSQIHVHSCWYHEAYINNYMSTCIYMYMDVNNVSGGLMACLDNMLLAKCNVCEREPNTH